MRRKKERKIEGRKKYVSFSGSSPPASWVAEFAHMSVRATTYAKACGG